MLVVSVDPGLTGAMALLCSRRGLLECEEIPTQPNGIASGSMKQWVDVRGLGVLLSAWSSRYGFAAESVMGGIERPITMPGLPAQTIASQFDTFGVIRAVLTNKLGALTHINPHEWKKLYGLAADKKAARACCLRLYPNAPVTLDKHHNRADAILIGHYLLRKFH